MVRDILGEGRRRRWRGGGGGVVFTFLHAGTGARRTGSFRGAGGGEGDSRTSKLGRESPFLGTEKDE